ncbi:hypothetical protein [Flavobacterium sp. KJJ]|uniref:hypothetical protein n=1 Tax=Flavobacterium sp. KJJ TaxID=1270193 RepID=UPI00049309A2|nr:hypothetical protein [Flavobacterium sp. KJJ]
MKIALNIHYFLLLYFIIDPIHLHFTLADTYDPKPGTVFMFTICIVIFLWSNYYGLLRIYKKIEEENSYDSKLALGTALLPTVFYGKISFNKK